MATITISDTPGAIARMFQSPGSRAGNESNNPIGEIEFSNLTFAIASKLSTNENFITIGCTLPPGFVYRLRYAQFNVDAVSLAELGQYEASAACLITENAVQVYTFAMYNESHQQLSGLADAEGRSNNAGSFKANQDSVTNDFSAFYSPIYARIARILIDASQGASIFTTRFLNSSASAAGAHNISYRFEFDMFTIMQFHGVNINRSILTY